MASDLKQTDAFLNERLESLNAFISASNTSIAKETFYNTANEQCVSLNKVHIEALNASRIFYALILLSQSATDENKKLIIFNLLKNAEIALEQKTWENALMLQAFSKMQPNRALDILNYLVDKKVNNSRTRNLILEFLKRNKKSLSLWALKYKRALKRIIRHAHISSKLHIAIEFLTAKILSEKIINDDLLNDYITTKDFKDLESLYKLPLTVARGFASKYKINKDEFLKTFAEKGKLTQKESRQQMQEFKAEGIDTEVDPAKLSLFDLYLYLDNLVTLPIEAEEYVEAAAKKEAKKIRYRFDDIAVILDTSLSMSGTEKTRKHALYRSLSISALLKEISSKYTEYRLNRLNTFIPKLTAETNYADALLEALKAKHKFIFIIADGYENTPYEGAANQIVAIYKKRIDINNEVTFVHFNPIFAAETKNVKKLFSDDLNIRSIGIRDEQSLTSALFLTLSQRNALSALKIYFSELFRLQHEETKKLFLLIELNKLELNLAIV